MVLLAFKGQWMGGAAADGKVYGIPYRGRRDFEGLPNPCYNGDIHRPMGILVLHVGTQTVSDIKIPESFAGSVNERWNGGVIVDNKLYGIPDGLPENGSSQILVLDLATRAVSGIKIPKSVCTGGSKWHTGVAVDGKVIAIPNGPPKSKIMVLDPFALVDLTAAIAALGPLTLQCMDGSKYVVGWPANIKYVEITT